MITNFYTQALITHYEARYVITINGGTEYSDPFRSNDPVLARGRAADALAGIIKASLDDEDTEIQDYYTQVRMVHTTDWAE